MNNETKLYAYGLKEDIKNEYEKKYSNYLLGRIVIEHKNIYNVITENEEVVARISGKFNYTANEKQDYPAVGDWVLLDRDSNKEGEAIIHGVLPRFSSFSRKVAGNRLDEQIVAANIDTVFICMALNNDFNIRRLERYISLSWDSGAKPVIILTKADLCQAVDLKVYDVEQVAIGIDVIVVSSITNQGIERVMANIIENETIVFIGSSGIGKSTLINALLGEEKQAVKGLRNDDKGRHTTTYRELIKLSTGGIIIDTPGMRELQILSADINTSFSDIEEFAENCYFCDCKHETEPKCAVKKAIEDGTLSEERLKSYKKLSKELKYQENKQKLKTKQLEKQKTINMLGSLNGRKKVKHR